MTVELPKDADGREIPLDTDALYDKNGERLAIYAWEYMPKLKHSKWRVLFLFDESGVKYYPDDYYLTPPDSWEKLLEDLDAAGNARHEETCAYFNRDKDAYCCTSCPAYKDDCVLIAMRDIASRIRKLRSADE